MKKALVFGGTGHVGSYLLQELLNSSDYSEITAVVRRQLTIQHPKLKSLVADYQSLDQVKDQIVADEVFITLGASEKEIEFGYPVLAARVARERGAKSVFIVTAVGANPNAGMAYIRTKGAIEHAIMNMGFDHTHFFRVSMIMGQRPHYRPMERTMMRIWKVIDRFFVGSMNRYRGITGSQVARAMVNAANNQKSSVEIYHWKEMMQLQTNNQHK